MRQTRVAKRHPQTRQLAANAAATRPARPRHRPRPSGHPPRRHPRARTRPGRRQRDLPSSPRPPAEPGQEGTPCIR